MMRKNHGHHCLIFLLCCVALSLGLRFDLQAQAPPGGGEASATASNPDLPTLNVRNFGATGDGNTDDTAAINRAMNACASRSFPFNGCNLHFPSGIYLTTGLTLPSYVHITGEGWATSVIELKPHTAADVLTIPVGTFNFSIVGVTIDGNATKRGMGNCLTVSATPVSPGEVNTASKQTAPINAFKIGFIEQTIFSNCARDGMHIEAFNYALFVDNVYIFNSGIYGIYDAGTDSIFTNFYIDTSGNAGLHITGANNKFSNAKIITSGTRNATEAAVYVAGGRNTFTAIEAQDNYTNGFTDTGDNNQFAACLSDANGYARANNNASSRSASGFVISGSGGIYLGDKVTSYRGKLADGNFPTQWPYTIRNPNQSRIDIGYDSTNAGPPAVSTVPQTSAPLADHAACIRTTGPPVVIGYCTTAPSTTGTCSCH